MGKAIIVVDMQNDFIDGALGTSEAQAMLPRMAAKLTAEQAASTVIIFTMAAPHGADYLQTQEGKKIPVEHCIRGTAGWQIADTLQPFVRGAQIVEKPAFGATDLPALLANYDEIELVGLCTDICVISNALLLKAFYPEKPISVDVSCCAGVTPESHATALAAVWMCQVEVR